LNIFILFIRRYFIDDHNLQHHLKSKVHKRRAKDLKTEAYTLEEAERAAGKGQYRAPQPFHVPGDQKHLYKMETDSVEGVVSSENK
jgi:hypothetical protein